MTQEAKLYKYFKGWNWAWFLKQIAPSISNGKPVFVTNSQLKPKDSKAETSFFIAANSDFLVVYT